MNPSLETAMMFVAHDFSGINSLKELARQESSRADMFRDLLLEILKKTGPVSVNGFRYYAQDDRVMVAQEPASH